MPNSPVTRGARRAAILAACTVVVVLGTVVLILMARSRGLPFDLPEVFAVGLALLSAIATYLGVRGIRDELRAREQIARDLAASERMHAGILEIAHDAIITIDSDQRITLYNQGAEATFGWTAQEAIGQPLSMLLPVRLRAAHARHVVQFAKSPEVSRGMGTRRKISGLRKSGEEFPADASISKLDTPTGRLYTVVLRDISERVRLEEDDQFLARAAALMGRSLDYEATLRSVVHLPVPYIGDCCVMVLNQGEPETTTRRLASVHEDPDLTKLLRRLEGKFLSSPNWPFHAADALATGEPIIRRGLTPGWEREGAPDDEFADVVAELGVCAFMTIPLRARERTVGTYTVISTDLARVCGDAQCAVAEELASHVAFAIDNARLYEAAQHASRARDELLAVVSHDLRNPLSAVAMCARVMHDQPPADEMARRELATAILRSTELMNRLIQDLLDVATIESGHLRITRVAQPLEPLVARVVDMLKGNADENELTLSSELEPNLPLVDADGTRVIQVLGNLVGNALKFTERGGRVTIHAEPRGSGVLVSVSDTGVGIPVDEQQQIFNRFWHTNRKSRTIGSGLGLAITKGIVEAHGGSLAVESQPGVGSTFSFTLPGVARDAVAPSRRSGVQMDAVRSNSVSATSHE